jgi:hypothetical protein
MADWMVVVKALVTVDWMVVVKALMMVGESVDRVRWVGKI